MKLNWNGWLYGLGSGFIGGGAAAVSAGVAEGFTDPQHADIHHLFYLMGVTFLASGIFSAVAFLKQSPLPPQEPK